jgi:hypothetical protein
MGERSESICSRSSVFEGMSLGSRWSDFCGSTKQDEMIRKDCQAARCKEVLYLREVQADWGLPILDPPSLGAH